MIQIKSSFDSFSFIALFDISIANIDCRYISTLLKNIDIDIDIDMVIFENIYINIDKAILKSPEDGWQGTAAPRGSAANNECQVDQEEDLTRNPNYQLVR